MGCPVFYLELLIKEKMRSAIGLSKGTEQFIEPKGSEMLSERGESGPGFECRAPLRREVRKKGRGKSRQCTKCWGKCGSVQGEGEVFL